MPVFPLRCWTPQAHSFLEHTIQSRTGLAAFDFDNTLVKNDFGETVMNELITDGLQGIRQKDIFLDKFRDRSGAERIWEQRNFTELQDYIWGQYQEIMAAQGLEAAYRWSSFLFSGWDEAGLKQFSRTVWDQQLASAAPDSVKPYQEFRDLIALMQQNSWQIKIVTASPQWIIEEVAPEFGLKATDVIGMHLAVADGVTLAEIIEPFTYGQGKVAALQQATGTLADLCFGDSINDLPLLQSAKKKGVLLDRGNEILKKQCEDFGCLIQPVFHEA